MAASTSATWIVDHQTALALSGADGIPSYVSGTGKEAAAASCWPDCASSSPTFANSCRFRALMAAETPGKQG